MPAQRTDRDGPREFRFTRSGDDEMDAIRALSLVLEPLDRTTAKRVLAWADKRYVDNDPLMDVPVDHMQSAAKFLEAINKTAQTIGVANGEVLLHAMARVTDAIRNDPELLEATAESAVR